MSIISIFALLVIFQFKHLIADYFLQGGFMLKKFLPGWNFFLPLLAHTLVHGLFTIVIVLFYAPSLWWLGLVDMTIHFIMDRIKAGPKYLGRFKALSAKEFKKVYDTYLHADNEESRNKAKSRIKSNIYFWWSLGVDQMVHHLTDLFVVYCIIVM